MVLAILNLVGGEPSWRAVGDVVMLVVALVFGCFSSAVLRRRKTFDA
jgi:hypothetical protein